MGCTVTAAIGKFFANFRLLNFRLAIFLLFLTCALGSQQAVAFTSCDGPGSGGCGGTGTSNNLGEPCPVIQKCTKANNQITQQDNGYHNMLQGMRGAMEPTINNYESAAEVITPPTPAQYTATDPQAMQYQGVTGAYGYGTGAITNFVAGTAPVSPSPPGYPTNPQLDPGIQGAMTRYNPNVNDTGSSAGVIDADDKHIFMVPKDTPADSLVDMFPWLYMDTREGAQYLLYRGTGGNTSAGVNNPLNLGAGQFSKAPTNAEESGQIDNPAEVKEFELNQSKCLKLRFRPNQCSFFGFNVDILASTLGSVLGQAGYISQSPALFSRLNMDSCTNQIIIPMGLNPNYVFNDELRKHDVAYNENWCQPFRTIPVDCYRNRLTPSGDCLPDRGSRDGWLYDYRAWGYLRLAWKSVLQDPYTPSGGGGLYYGGQMGIGMPPYLTSTTSSNMAAISALTLSFPGTLELVRDNPADPNNLAAAIPTEIPGETLYGAPFISLFPGGSVGPVGTILSYIGSYNGGLFTINDLARQRVERIWDPTHPYSPRWDFRGTDRLFSVLARLTNPPVTGMGFSSSTSTCIVRCAAVPVDILSFRLLAFSACMGCRISINAATFWAQTLYMMQDVTISFMGVSATCRGVSQDRAIENTLRNRVLGPISGLLGMIPIPGATHGRLSGNAGETIRVSIWGITFTIPTIIAGGCHYYISPGTFTKSNFHNVDGVTIPLPISPGWLLVNNPLGPQPNGFDSLWPICSTKYDYRDSFANLPACAPCTIMSGDANIFNGVRNCCDDVAHALAPLNTLKIRNTIFNPGLLPTPEGYTFKEYWSFRDDRRVSPYSPASDEDVEQIPDPSGGTMDYVGSHMPYMRWWDTGTAAGGASGWVGIADYNPDLDCGRYDTIVGVGTEDWEGDETKYPLTPAAGSPSPITAPSYNPNPADPRYVQDWEHNNAAKYCRYGGNGFAVDGETGVPFSGEAIRNIVTAFGATAYGIDQIENFLGISLGNIGIPPFYRCIRLRTIDIGNRQLGGDAMTSWMELKLYQTRAIQRGLNCLPQYEKFHKPYGSEEFTLNALGASYNVPILLNRSAVDNTDALDPTKGPDKGYYKVPYKGATAANPPKQPDAAGSDYKPQTVYLSGMGGDSYETQIMAWPLAWRGYNSEGNNHPAADDCRYAFPNFAGDGSFAGLGGYFPSLPSTFTVPCASTLTGSLVSGWTIPGMMSPLGNVIGPAFSISYPQLWPLMPAGLDRAKVGDIVYLTHEDINYSLAITTINQIMGWGSTSYFAGSLPYAAVIVGTRTSWMANDGSTRAPAANVAACAAFAPAEPNCFTACEASVTLAEVNNGKFPDVCGNTDMYGFGQNRTIYKEWLPERVMDVIFPPGTVVQDTCGHAHTAQNIGYNALTGVGGAGVNKFNTNYGSCADTKMAQCTYADIGLGTVNTDSVNLWNHFRVYRPLWDIRE